MGVPRHFPTSAENSTRLSYDDAYIQKIPARTDATLRPSVAPTHKPTSRFNRTTERINSYSDRDRTLIRKRFQELFNDTSLLNSDFPWLSSTNLTIDHSSLYDIPLPPKIHLVFKTTPTWKYYLSVPTIMFFVLAVLKLCLYYQRPRTEYFPRRRLSEEQRGQSVIDTDPEPPNEPISPPAPAPPIIIDSEFSIHNNSLFDTPPSYSQCAVDNIGTDNKIHDNTSEDLPPPYSICIVTLNETDGIPKVHKGQSEEEQSRTETDIHLNNLDRNNVDQSGSTANTLNRTVESITDGGQFNNLIPNNNESGDDNTAKAQPRSSS